MRAKSAAPRLSDYEVRNAISGVDLAHNFLTGTGGHRPIEEHRAAIRKAARALMQIDRDLDAREKALSNTKRLEQCAEAFERRNERRGEELCEEREGSGALPLTSGSMTCVPLVTAERQKWAAKTGEPLIISDAMLINEMNRWTALRYNGVPTDQAAANIWYEIEDYQPKTEPARAAKAQFLRQFPYVALKRSKDRDSLSLLDTEERG